MKPKHLIMSLCLLSSVGNYLFASDTFEFNYGPQGKLHLHKSADYMGIKATTSERNKSFKTLLGDTAEGFKAAGNLGGFQILKIKSSKGVDNLNQEINKIRKLNTVAVATHVFHTKVESNVPYIPTGSLYLKFKDNADIASCNNLLMKYSLQILEPRGKSELIVSVMPQGSLDPSDPSTSLISTNPIKTAIELQKLEELIEIAEPELATPIAIKAPTNDQLLANQWHLKNTGTHRGTSFGLKAGADARVVEAWNILGNKGSADITIAVIDDGFDLKHPDLKEKVVKSPWDFTRNSDNPMPGSGDWHGTACAGVAVGKEGGGDIIGAAPNAALMPIRWGTGISDTEIEQWFNHATDNGADVVSNSWGVADYFQLSTRMTNAIKRCATEGRNGKGCVVVFAAGNDNHNINSSPDTSDGFAIHPNVIAVAATTSMDERSHYSNFGKEIWISAPSSGAGGMGILTADVSDTDRSVRGYARGNYTYDFGGTSSSCPLVAGIAGLVLSANPALNALEVKNIIKDTARKLHGNTGHTILYGHGCINAADAVLAALRSRGTH